jgi:hypothetical protein
MFPQLEAANINPAAVSVKPTVCTRIVTSWCGGVSCFPQISKVEGPADGRHKISVNIELPHGFAKARNSTRGNRNGGPAEIDHRRPPGRFRRFQK